MKMKRREMMWKQFDSHIKDRSFSYAYEMLLLIEKYDEVADDNDQNGGGAR